MLLPVLSHHDITLGRPVFDKPRLKAHLTARLSGAGRVFLLGEDRYHLVHGVAAAAIAPYLDGTHTPADIVEATSGEISYTDCVLALATYSAAGHLDDGVVTDRRTAAAWEARGVSSAEAARQLSEQTVTLVRVGDVPVGHIVTALRKCGVQVRVGDPMPDGGPVVVMADEYLDPRLSELDMALRAEGRPWLLAKPVGLEVWIGPYFRPDVTGCWHCLAERLDGNRPIGQFLRMSADDDEPVRASIAASPASLGLAAYFIANAVTAMLLDGELPALEGVLLSVRTTTLQSEQHELIRRPQCGACGDPWLAAPTKVELCDGLVPVTLEGGRRAVPVDVTYRRLEKHVSRLLGAVSTLRPVGGTYEGVAHNYVAGHNFAVQPHNLDGLRRTLRGQSGGKGHTDTHARTSALCEAIERYCGVWRGDQPTTTASLAELDDLALAPNDLLLFSERQYENRVRWNASAAVGRLHTIPAPLDPNRPINWTTAWSLTQEQERLVPAGYAWFGHPDLREHGYCLPDANGNAAGNTIEEAVLQGFCELVERDAVALWWYNKARRPGFDLDSMGDPLVAQLRRLHANQGRELWVLDLTTDLGVPTFAAVSRRIDHPVQDVLLGFGAHLDPRIAVLRALSELNQFLPSVTERRRDGSAVYREDDQSILDWWRTVRVEQEPWLLPGTAAPTSLATYPVLGGADIAEDVRLCVGIAQRAGLEVIVLDQTRPDIELAVVKVMVPGLRHFWRRLGPGRLYDVPVRLGWLDTPTTEDGCNPVSVFL